MRLDKLLADMQAGTRSEVKQYIRQGKVTVDGSRVSPKQQVDPGTQTICFFGKEIHYQKYVYYMLYKPQNCVTARQDAGHKTVMDYIVDKRKDLSPVGRTKGRTFKYQHLNLSENSEEAGRAWVVPSLLFTS